MSATATDLAHVDLFDMRWWEDGPPHELFSRLRSEDPVHGNPLPDGSSCWALTRHAEVSAVSRDTKTFSSQRGGVFLHPDQLLPLDVMTNMLLYMDPPGHTRYRLILQKVFTPRSVARLEDTIRARVTRTIDRVIERGECDFVADIAVPVPLGVLTELMGVPELDIAQFYAWTEQIERHQRDAEPNTAQDVFASLAGYLHAQIERQTEEAIEESLVMKLRNAEVDGARLTDLEIITFFGLLAFAGNDTTRNTAATGMLALLEHPEALAELTAQPALIEDAVEEILRYTSVVQWFKRTAACDTELDGCAIAEGDRVILWYGSASRDEAVFEDPDAFDIHRRQPDHKAFGGGGRHFCLGAGLARLELRIVLEEVTRRMRDLRLTGTVRRLPSNWAHGLTEMPVRFMPAARESAH